MPLLPSRRAWLQPWTPPRPRQRTGRAPPRTEASCLLLPLTMPARSQYLETWRLQLPQLGYWLRRGPPGQELASGTDHGLRPKSLVPRAAATRRGMGVLGGLHRARPFHPIRFHVLGFHLARLHAREHRCPSDARIFGRWTLLVAVKGGMLELDFDNFEMRRWERRRESTRCRNMCWGWR